MTGARGRMRRVDEAVREVIADSVAGGVLTDPRLGFVTITEVQTSPDLRHAKVFVSVFGPGADAASDSIAALESAHGVLQAQIAAELRLKRTPALTFVRDDTAERATHLDALMREQEAQR